MRGTGAGLARPLDAGGDIDPGRRDRPQRAGDVGRVEPAGQGDRHFPCDRRGQALRGTHAGSTRVRAARGVEEQALGTAGQVGMPARHDVGDGGVGIRGSVAGR